jgi:hypothetical protein
MGRLSRHQFAHFKNPTTHKLETVKVLDEIWTVEPERVPETCPGNEDGWLETVFVAQLIELTNSHRQIRICYFTRRPGLGPDGWRFAQYAPLMSPDQCRTIVDGIRDRGWLSSPRQALGLG